MTWDTEAYWRTYWDSKLRDAEKRATKAEADLKALHDRLMDVDRRLKDLQHSAEENDQQIVLSRAVDQIRAILDMPRA